MWVWGLEERSKLGYECGNHQHADGLSPKDKSLGRKEVQELTAVETRKISTRDLKGEASEAREKSDEYNTLKTKWTKYNEKEDD